MRSTTWPSALVKFPRAKSAGPVPSSITTSLLTAESKLPPTFAQVVPFHFLTPPTDVPLTAKEPLAYRARPVPSLKATKESGEPLRPLPTADQLEPFQRA